jgi:hypothetical protein
MPGDPILEAKTVEELTKALDEKYGWELPKSFLPGTDLGLLWAAGIEVKKDPKPGVLYQAIGTEPISSVVAFPLTIDIRVDEVPSREEKHQCQQRQLRKRKAGGGPRRRR